MKTVLKILASSIALSMVASCGSNGAFSDIDLSLANFPCQLLRTSDVESALGGSVLEPRVVEGEDCEWLGRDRSQGESAVWLSVLYDPNRVTEQRLQGRNLSLVKGEESNPDFGAYRVDDAEVVALGRKGASIVWVRLRNPGNLPTIDAASSLLLKAYRNYSKPLQESVEMVAVSGTATAVTERASAEDTAQAERDAVSATAVAEDELRIQAATATAVAKLARPGTYQINQTKSSHNDYDLTFLSIQVLEDGHWRTNFRIRNRRQTEMDWCQGCELFSSTAKLKDSRGRTYGYTQWGPETGSSLGSGLSSTDAVTIGSGQSTDIYFIFDPLEDASETFSFSDGYGLTFSDLTLK